MLAATSIVAACGGGSSTSSPASFLTASPGSGSTASSSGTPAATSRPGGAVACLPHDTPVDQAPAAIADVWRNRDVMIVPACSVFDVKLPTFVNLARSAGLSVADAMAMAAARVRSEQMVNWALKTGQLSIADPLSGVTLYTKAAVDAVHAGYSVTGVPDAPGCAIPNKITVLRLPPETVAGMDQSGSDAKPGPYGLVVQYGPGDCAAIGIKGTETKVVVSNDPTQVEDVLGGVVRHDAQVGVDYWYYVTAGGECGKDAVVALLCHQAGY